MVLSELARIVVRYRNYSPETGRHDTERTQQEYAQQLGVSRVFITQITNGDREPGVDMLRSLSRLYPAAAKDIATALSANEAQPEPALAD